MKKSLILSALLLAGSFSYANDWYVGIGVGQSTHSNNDIDSLKSVGASIDDDDTGYKIFVGYNFNPFFAAEGFYADLGEATTSYTHGSGDYSAKTSVKTFGFGVKVKYPVYQYFEPFAKLGVHTWDAEGSTTHNNSNKPLGSTTSKIEDGTNFYYGIGFNVPVHKKVDIIFEWERYELGSYGETDMTTISAAYKF